MKKRLLIGKIIGTIGLLIFTMGISYIITYYLDRSLYENISLLVTFEDDTTFSLLELKELEKEEALKTYPYVFNVLNKGKSEVTYKIEIKDEEISGLDRNSLDYILFLNDKEVKTGTLSEIADNILYEAKIKKNQTDIYKLYIYLNEEKEEVSYKYSLKIISK